MSQFNHALQDGIEDIDELVAYYIRRLKTCIVEERREAIEIIIDQLQEAKRCIEEEINE